MDFNKAEFNASYGAFGQLPLCSCPEVSFSGRSNVGKSTLINKLLNRKSLARVSAVPGKTATINFYSVDGIFLTDLPGYGYAKVSKSEKHRWSELIEGYLNSDRDIALVVQLIDMRHPPTADDIMMVNFLIDNEMPFIIVLTKADKLSARQRAERMEGFAAELPCFEDINVIPFSSQTGEGVEKLREIIQDAASYDDTEDIS